MEASTPWRQCSSPGLSTRRLMTAASCAGSRGVENFSSAFAGADTRPASPTDSRSTPGAGHVAWAAFRERIRFTLAMLPQARPLSPAYMLHQVRELLRDWS